MKRREQNSIFKSRIYLNYFNNILEHSEIEEAIEREVLKSFKLMVGTSFSKATFRTCDLTRIDCYYKYQSFVTERAEVVYLYSKAISYYKNDNGYWTKKVTHFKDRLCT